jgi:hypothetical protein
MPDFIKDKEYLKKNILPSLEKRVNSELQKLADYEYERLGVKSVYEKEKILTQIKTKFLSALGHTSLDFFFEEEEKKILVAFEKHFPYKSVDDFIENAFSLNGSLKTKEID